MRFSLTAFLLSLLLPSLCLTSEAAGKRRPGKNAPSAQTDKPSEKQQKPDTGKEKKEEPQPPPVVDPAAWLKKNSLFQSGLKAMADHLPDVAARQFNDLLASRPPGETLPYIHRQLGEALVRNGQYKEGLHILKDTPETAKQPAALFWEALANKGLGYYSSALHLFNSLEDDATLPPELKRSLLWQMAEIHMLLRNPDQGSNVLKRLLQDSDQQTRSAARLALGGLALQRNKPEEAGEFILEIVNSPKKFSPQARGLASLIQAKALVMQNKPQEAMPLLSSLIAQPKMLPRIVSMAKLATAEAEIAAEKMGQLPREEKGKGEDRLLNFIETEPDSPLIPEAFNILRAAEAFRDAESFQKLQDWAGGEHPQRSPYAMGTLARELISKKEDLALQKLFLRAGEKFPDHPAAKDLQYIILQYLYDEEKLKEAGELAATLKDSEAKSLFMKAGLLFSEEKFREASALYLNAFDLLEDQDGVLEQKAAYNGYIAALHEQLPEILGKIGKSARLSSDTYADLKLEIALEAASRLQESAKTSLERFIKTYPAHPRLADAWLALGELALYLENPDQETTIHALESLKPLALSEEQKERMARLRILLPEYMGQWPAAIQAARDYLSAYQDKEKKIPMQLKLGELLYRNNDFNQAHLYLQNYLSHLEPDSPYRIPALFLSGKAAQQTGTQQSLSTALDLFEKVEQTASTYRPAAVIERASILMRQGKPQQVINLLDAFIDSPNLTEESHRLALALEAEAWASLGSTDSKALDKARELTGKILEEKELPLAWKNRTLFQQAQLSERAGDATLALRDYHRIISTPPDSQLRREWYWYYQAGFAAMHLLEDMKNWAGAIAIAESMAKAGGPRSEEALNRAKKIRLEHFVWGAEPEESTSALPEKETPVEVSLPQELTLPPSSLPRTEPAMPEKTDKKKTK